MEPGIEQSIRFSACSKSRLTKVIFFLVSFCSKHALGTYTMISMNTGLYLEGVQNLAREMEIQCNAGLSCTSAVRNEPVKGCENLVAQKN